jgi:ABC-type sugar transport system ATPase subunit
MLMIARGHAQRARMVVLDEPTAALTDEEIRHLFAVIRRLRSEGIAVVYVSHRLDEIFDVTERVVVMRNARVVADEPTGALDRRSLIAHITGHEDAQTAIERRRSRRVGASPATDVVLDVDGVAAPPRLQPCSFQLRRGEILGLAGLIGAGRTELVRAVFGADRRAGGAIAVDGKVVDVRNPEAAMAAGMALLPEDRKSQGNVMEFSVRHNITLASLREFRIARHLPIPSGRSERTRSVGLVNRLSIRTPSDRQAVRLLSGGNQQKVVIARWLAEGADILFFDEPTHGVDVDGKEEIYNIAEELAAQGKSVIFISSEFSELVGLCHRILVMREGRIVGELDGDEITERSIVAMCYGERIGADV